MKKMVVHDIYTVERSVFPDFVVQGEVYLVYPVE
jgi:hypothetical protein